MRASYKITDWEKIILGLGSLLTDDSLQKLCLAEKLKPGNLRTFWQQFAVIHLANSCMVSLPRMRDGLFLQTRDIIEAYDRSLQILFAYYDFSRRDKNTLYLFGYGTVLPLLAGLVDKELEKQVSKIVRTSI